jgi:hypothetical protein
MATITPLYHPQQIQHDQWVITVEIFTKTVCIKIVEAEGLFQ